MKVQEVTFKGKTYYLKDDNLFTVEQITQGAGFGSFAKIMSGYVVRLGSVLGSADEIVLGKDVNLKVKDEYKFKDLI